MATSTSSENDEILMMQGAPLPLEGFHNPSPSRPLIQYPFYFKQPTEKYTNLFNKYKEIFIKRLGENMISLYQMGSGAIPGMPGSPLIDFLLTIKTYPPTAEVMKILQDLNMGFMFVDGKGPQGAEDTWMRSIDFPPEGDFEEFKVAGSLPPEGHLGRITVHIVHYTSPKVVQYLSYVEYLKSNENAFRRYRDVKIQGAKMSAAENVQDKNPYLEYKKHKSVVVTELMAEALEWKEKNGIRFHEEQMS